MHVCPLLSPFRGMVSGSRYVRNRWDQRTTGVKMKRKKSKHFQIQILYKFPKTNSKKMWPNFHKKEKKFFKTHFWKIQISWFSGIFFISGWVFLVKYLLSVGHRLWPIVNTWKLHENGTQINEKDGRPMQYPSFLLHGSLHQIQPEPGLPICLNTK